MTTYTKDGRDVLVFSPTQAVNLRAQGWVEKDEEPPEPAYIVGEQGPEVVVPVSPPAAPEPQ